MDLKLILVTLHGGPIRPAERETGSCAGSPEVGLVRWPGPRRKRERKRLMVQNGALRVIAFMTHTGWQPTICSTHKPTNPLSALQPTHNLFYYQPTVSPISADHLRLIFGIKVPSHMEEGEEQLGLISPNCLQPALGLVLLQWKSLGQTLRAFLFGFIWLCHCVGSLRFF